MACSGMRNFRIKFTELLIDIQRNKSLPDPKYTIIQNAKGTFAELRLVVDKNGATVEFTSTAEKNEFEATENVAKKAIDSVTSTYSLNIVDYNYEAFQNMSAKYVVMEMKVNQLHESNRKLLSQLSSTQLLNEKLTAEVKQLKRGKAKDGVDKNDLRKQVTNLVKVKDELQGLLAYDNEYRHVDSEESINKMDIAKY